MADSQIDDTDAKQGSTQSQPQKAKSREDDYKDSVMQDIYNDISSSDSEEDIVTDQNKLTSAKT